MFVASFVRTNVRFGSLADIATSQRDVRFAPESRHWPDESSEIVSNLITTIDRRPGERIERAGSATARRGAEGTCEQTPRRPCGGVGAIAARDFNLFGRLSDSHPAARRAHRHQSGSRGLQRGPPLHS